MTAMQSMSRIPPLVASVLLLLPRASGDTALEVLNALDVDKDERVSKKEWKKSRKAFDALDLDKDGYLVLGELVAMMAARGPAAKDAKDAMVAIVPLNERLQEFDIVRFDADRDGRIAAREYEDWVFALADQDQDGMLRLEEAYQLVRFGEFGAASNRDEGVFVDRHDRSRDGRVSRSEFALDEKLFAGLDADGDGVLAPAELGNGRPDGLDAFANMNPDTFLEKHDKNGDGVLAGSELPGGTKSLFARADKDEDGKIDRDELADTLRTAQRYQFATIAPTFMERYDLNADGKVVRREYPGDDTTFARLDVNGDGAVTRADG
jgi:Ca2+-binding EF-hand superfamily protein